MVFDNVNWNSFINNILSYIKDWKYLIVKSHISKTSYSTSFYYSKDGKEFDSLYDEIDDEKISSLENSIIPELKKIAEKFDDHKEIMFLTIKVEKNGNVKIIYRDIKEGNKLPFDESFKYLKLNENDKNNLYYCGFVFYNFLLTIMLITWNINNSV